MSQNINPWVFEMQSPENLSVVLNEHVWYEIIYALAVPVYDLSNYVLWEDVNLARMGHARVMISFFETSADGRKAKRFMEDDVISEGFGFQSSTVAGLSDDDRLRFRKDLFHLSYARLRHRESPQDKPWPPSILQGVHDKCVVFIQHLLSQKGTQSFQLDRARWEKLRELLTSGHELVFTAGLDSSQRLWTHYNQGRKLPDGKSVLTNLTPSNQVVLGTEEEATIG